MTDETQLSEIDRTKRILGMELQDAMIACLLENAKKCWPLVQPLLDGECFTNRDRRLLWEHISASIEMGDPVDPIVVAERMASTQTDGARWYSVVAEMIEVPHSVGNAETYAKAVRDLRDRRRLVAISRELATMAFEHAADEALAMIQAKLGELLRTTSGRQIMRLSTLAKQYIDDLENEVTGLKWGYLDLDRLLNPMAPGDLIVLGARPSMGKTTLALNLAENVAKAGGVVYVRSAEMDSMSLCEKIISSQLLVEYRNLINRSLGREDYIKLADIGKLKDSAIFIEDSGGPRVADIRADALRVRLQCGRLDLIVVDYLQLMQGDGNRGESRVAELSKITMGLKNLAKEMACPLVLLSQLNREVEKRSPPIPRMADLRDSGSIEQDADVILFLYRDSEYDENSKWGDLTQIDIAKQRKGARNKRAYLLFDKPHSRFVNASQADIIAATEEHIANEKPKYNWQDHY